LCCIFAIGFKKAVGIASKASTSREGYNPRKPYHEELERVVERMEATG